MAEAPYQERTIPRLVSAASQRYSGGTAIEDGDARLAYSDLEAAMLGAARAMQAAGLRPGDRAAVWAPNILEWIVAALGIQASGGVLVTINTRHKGEEAAYALSKSSTRMLFTMGDFLDTNYVAQLEGFDLPALEAIVTLRGDADGAVAWDEFLARGDSVSEAEARAVAAAVAPDDTSDLIFTSGTTGNPKGVMTSHGQNLRAFETWSDVVGLRQGDRYLVVGPFFHTFGYKAGWLASIMRGATILPHQVFDAAAVLERIARDRVNVLPGAPTVYQSLLAHPGREQYDLSSLRLAVTGAAAIPVELIHRMRDELGFDTVLTAYGLTECCGFVTICYQGDDAETIATTSGRAIPGVEVDCVDPDGKRVAPGEPGEVWVRGYNVMSGYFGDAAETEEAVDADGWLHTGDVGVLDERGYLRITDRIKDMFIMGGFNCYPAEIENLMYGSGKFAQVAVIGVPDERMGEVGMAFVVPLEGETLEKDAVVALCRERMANYKVPRYVEVRSELPLNATGKVEKVVLREEASRLLSEAG